MGAFEVWLDSVCVCYSFFLIFLIFFVFIVFDFVV